MITGLKKNKFTQTLATGAAAIGVLAGVGLATSAPAQAGVFTLRQSGTNPNGALCDTDNTPCIRDTEWGFPGSEPIWSTFPDKTVPGTGFQAPLSEPGVHGIQGVNGWDNPLVTYAGPGGGTFKIEFFGSGTAAQKNNFLWDKGDGNGFVSLFGQQMRPGLGDGNPPEVCANVFGNPCAMRTVSAVNGKLPFQFVAGTSPVTNIPNGTPYVPGIPHYFATLNGTWAITTGTNMVFIGLSDRGGNDDDAADFVVKITAVTPEPGTVLGLLAVGGLGAFMKRKKQG